MIRALRVYLVEIIERYNSLRTTCDTCQYAKLLYLEVAVLWRIQFSKKDSWNVDYSIGLLKFVINDPGSTQHNDQYTTVTFSAI